LLALQRYDWPGNVRELYVLRVLEHENWNQSRAARSLGVHRDTLIARLAVCPVAGGPA
jgi:DNA-binding NtrC family response regulator